jgi:hypothetical protein
VSRIHGIAGVFLHASQPERLADWYALHFGIAFVSDNLDRYHTEFHCRDDADPAMRWSTVFAIMPARTPAGAERGEYTINYRVDDLRAVVEQLAAEGVAVEPIQQEGEGELRGAEACSPDCEIPRGIASSCTSRCRVVRRVTEQSPGHTAICRRFHGGSTPFSMSCERRGAGLRVRRAGRRGTTGVQLRQNDKTWHRGRQGGRRGQMRPHAKRWEEVSGGGRTWGVCGVSQTVR